MAGDDYHAMALRVGAHREPRVLHLVREDAEASLCGVPRSSLDITTVPDGLLCGECIDWLSRRRAVSAQYKRAKR